MCQGRQDLMYLLSYWMPQNNTLRWLYSIVFFDYLVDSDR